jgi:hypothetical protein
VANVRALALFAFTGSTSAAIVLASGLGAASAIVEPQSAPTASATAFATIGFIESGGSPEGLAVSSDDTVYVPTQNGGYVGIINPGTTGGQFDDSILVTYPRSAAVGSDGTVYIANYTGRNVEVVNPGQNVVGRSIPVLNLPRSVAVNEDDTVVAASWSVGGGSISIIAPGSTTETATIIGPPDMDAPYGVATDSKGNFYVGSDQDTVGVINANATSISGTITGLSGATSLTLGADDTLYVASRNGNRVDIVPADAATPDDTVAVGNLPVAIAASTDGDVYTSNFSSNNVSFIRVTASTSSTLVTAPRTHGVVVTSTGLIYIAQVTPASVIVMTEVGANLAASSGEMGSTTRINLSGLPERVLMDDSTVAQVWWGDDTVAFSRVAGENAVSVNVPAGSGSVPIVLSLNGENAVTAGTFTYVAVQPPPPPIPSSAPLDVAVVAGDSSAEVSWQPPSSSGSFPISTYQVRTTPASAGCLIPASTTSCTIGAVRNGSEYEVQVRALTGAGWSAWSDPVSVVPEPPAPVASLVITGSRDGRAVLVDGATTGMVGERLTPWVRLPGQSGFTPGSGVRTVDADGEFTWQRQINKKVYVYFRAGDDLRSNRVIIPAR